MKKTMTMVVNNRNRYVDSILKDLLDNDLEGYTLYMAVEPNYWKHLGLPEIPEQIPSVIIRNPIQLGIRENQYQLLRFVFENIKSDFNVYLEDDLHISPDTFHLANWYGEIYLPNNPNCVSGCFHNKMSKGNPIPNELVRVNHKIECLGHVETRESWYNHFRDNCHKNDHLKRTLHWSIGQYIKNNPEFYCLKPKLARSTHIGKEGGTYYREHLYGQDYVNLILSNHTKVLEYTVDESYDSSNETI